MLRPSFANGFAPRDGQAIWPELWRGCVGAWNPGLGPTGLRLYDWSPYRNHGTLTSMTADAGWVVSNGQRALTFNGSSNYVAINPISQLATKFSVSAFVVPASASGNASVVSSRSTLSVSPILFQLNRAASSYSMIVRDNANVIANATGGSVSVGKLTHICGVRDENTVSLYVDGLLAATATASIGAITIDSADIGAVVAGSGATRSSYWDGQILQVTAYNRILVPNEIRLLATRPGIAYEMAPRRWTAAMIDAYRRRTQYTQLVGGGVI